MGDRTSVRLYVGGKLPASEIEAFVALCEEERLQIDWMDDVTAEALREAAKEGALMLGAQEVNYANLPDMEQWLRDHGLSFRKEWDAGGEYGAGATSYDPSDEEHREVDYLQSEGHACLSAADIRRLGSFEAILARLERMERPVPAFEIVE